MLGLNFSVKSGREECANFSTCFDYRILNMMNKSKQEFTKIFNINLGTMLTYRKLAQYVYTTLSLLQVISHKIVEVVKTSPLWDRFMKKCSQYI